MNLVKLGNSSFSGSPCLKTVDGRHSMSTSGPTHLCRRMHCIYTHTKNQTHKNQNFQHFLHYLFYFVLSFLSYSEPYLMALCDIFNGKQSSALSKESCLERLQTKDVVIVLPPTCWRPLTFSGLLYRKMGRGMGWLEWYMTGILWLMKHQPM